MRSAFAIGFLGLSATILSAQGPPGRFGGPRGLDGPGGFEGRWAGLIGAGPGSRTPITGAPYSATETLIRQHSLADGNQISTKSQSNVYRDSQGRIRTEETVTPPAAAGRNSFSMITIFDPVAGSQYVLDSSTMSARQTNLPRARSAASASQRGPAPQARPARPNVTTTDLGTQMVNGVLAKGTQLTETIPAGAIGNAQPIQVVRVTWVSTELNVPVQIKTSDPRNGTSDMELTNIVQTEPSAALFTVPAGYTVQQAGGPGGGPRASGRRGGPRPQ